MEKVLVQVIYIFQDALLAAHDHIVDGAQVLSILGEADAAGVRDDGDVEFCSHEQDGDDFVDAAQPTRVDLADVYGARGEELLEHDAVLTHLSCRNADAVWF